MENNNSNSNQEIDLIYLIKKINSSISNIGYILFKFIRFFVKKIYIITALVVIGILLGSVVQTKNKSYKNEVVVIPNFGSSDYLYSMADNYKKIEVKNKTEQQLLDNIIEIKVKPILHVDNYFNDEKQIDFLKLLAEKGIKINDFLKNNDIRKENKSFLITISTKDENNSKKSVNLFFNYLNNSKYYLEKGKIIVRNLEKHKIELNQSIDQINGILNNLKSNKKIQESNNQLSINNYENLNNIIDLKNIYLAHLQDIDENLSIYSKTIYPVSVYYNKEFSKDIFHDKKVSYPIVLVLIFLLINIFIRFYKKYNKAEKA